MPQHSWKDVPLRLIDETDETFAIRHYCLSDRSITALAANLDKNGLLHPPVVRRNGDRYQLVCGFRRMAAIRKLAQDSRDWRSVRCKVVRSECREELLRLAIDENVQRRPLSPMETALAIDKLAEDLGKSYADIGAVLGLGSKTIQRYRKLLSALPDVRTAVHDGRIEFTHAVCLAGLPSDQQRELLRRVIVENMSTVDLRRLLKSRRERGLARSSTVKELRRRTSGMASVREMSDGDVKVTLSLSGVDSLDDVARRLKDVISALA